MSTPKRDDPFLLRNVTTLLADCGLRPEECFRLEWEHVRDGAVHIPCGKTPNARRTIPLTQRAADLLQGLAQNWAQSRKRRYGEGRVISRMVSLSVPQHKELAPGTLRALIRASKLTVAEFVSLL